MIDDQELYDLYTKILDLIEDASNLAPPAQIAPMLAAVVATYLSSLKRFSALSESKLKRAWNKSLKRMQVAIRDHERSLQS